ncbi:MAG TPA: rhodanese-like domain-containing protein [Pyrinomonadaceae bacterium]|nr:rhodanese-like domain-containing protein [Pyrinomonadaceae bacterium]
MQAERTKLHKYFETAVNISLLAICLILVGVIAKKYFIPAAAPIKSVKAGDKISFPNLTGTKGQKSIFIFLQSGCQYCTKSGYFYNNLAKETAENPNTKIIAVFSEKDDRFQDYLKELGLQNLETRQANFAEIGIEGTPTLAIADENGVVQNVWKGMLSPKKQLEVKQNLGLKTADPFIEEAELSDLRKKGQAVVVIDIRDRETYAQKHFTDAKNIPADELPVRAINEISPSNTVVVYGTFDYEGENAQEVLAREGFREVYILNYKFQ